MARIRRADLARPLASRCSSKTPNDVQVSHEAKTPLTRGPGIGRLQVDRVAQTISLSSYGAQKIFIPAAGERRPTAAHIRVGGGSGGLLRFRHQVRSSDRGVQVDPGPKQPPAALGPRWRRAGSGSRMQRILQRVGGGSGGRAVGRVGVPAIHEQPLRCGGGGGGMG